uniref:uncharacterized protein isoform X2 n=1 Tax=Myxine glutinosa TaxID=7769 RepID=UPI00358F9A5D
MRLHLGLLQKGKSKPLDVVEKDKTGCYVNLFFSTGEVDGSVDPDVASELVCRMYGQSKTRDVNEARYNKLMQMTGKVDQVIKAGETENMIIIIKSEYLTTPLIMPFIDFQENPLVNIKRIDCALLPPSRRTLDMKIRRTQYVTALWTHAGTASPGDGLSPTDYGWSVNDNILKPTWFEGPVIPDSLFANGRNNAEDMEVVGDSESELEVESKKKT